MIALNDQDYKYAIQTFSNVYIGGRLNCDELCELDDVPSKFKDIACRVLKKEMGISCLEEYLMQMDEDCNTAQVLQQMQVIFKISFLQQKIDKTGKEISSYETKDYTYVKFMQLDRPDFINRVIIQELSFKKRHLMSVHM